MKIVLSIAGSDSSGGAGIQADIKSGFYHKVFMTTAITAVTVQNTLGVTDVVVLKPEFVVKQIKSVIEDFKVNCIKIGMLSSKELIFEVFETIKDLNIPIVLDPVAISRAGSKLLDDEAINSLKSNFKYAYFFSHSPSCGSNFANSPVSVNSEAVIEISKLSSRLKLDEK